MRSETNTKLDYPFGYFRVALAIPKEGDDHSKCSMYAVNFTDLILAGVQEADPSWPVQSCQYGWEYNFTDIPYATVATEVSNRSIILITNEVAMPIVLSWTGFAIMPSCPLLRKQSSSSVQSAEVFCSDGLLIATAEFQLWLVVI